MKYHILLVDVSIDRLPKQTLRWNSSSDVHDFDPMVGSSVAWLDMANCQIKAREPCFIKHFPSASCNQYVIDILKSLCQYVHNMSNNWLYLLTTCKNHQNKNNHDDKNPHDNKW